VAGDDLNTIRDAKAAPILRLLAAGDLATNVADPIKGGAEVLGKAAVKGVVKGTIHGAASSTVHSAAHAAGLSVTDAAAHATSATQHLAATASKAISSASKASSSKLKANLLASGKKMHVGDHAHHIVAGNAKAARRSRSILAKHNIDINDAANGQFLPGAVHSRVHTKKYFQAVDRTLQRAKTKQDVDQALQHIANKLKATGKYP
jgi:hypothetical protein